MHRLRSSPHLARLVLAWLLLAMGVAVASPLVRPAAMAMVCTASGATLVAADGGEAPPATGHGLDCPLCLHLLAPPPPAVVSAAPAAAPVAHPGFAPVRSAYARLVAPPLPARGPPTNS